MPTPPTIDLDALLAPIDGDNPTGSDLRDDHSHASVLRAIKDAAGDARKKEKQADYDEEVSASPSEWRTVLELAPKVLMTRSKDLDVAGWYIEALLRAEGFAGLRDGFRLAKGLVETYWDSLYPLPDEDGIATRVGTLAGLNGESGEGTLIQPIRKVPFTAGSEASYALYHYNQALDLAKITDPYKKQARIDAGAVSWEAFERSVRETPAEVFRETLDDLEECLAAFEELGNVLYEKARGDAPPGGNIRGVLNAAIDALKYAARDKLAAADAAADAAAEAEATVAETTAAAGDSGGTVALATARTAVAGGPLATRDDAFKLLLQIADFFRKTEPHSPISYTLEEVVRRGRLTLPELLEELITDETTRQYFFIASGVKPPQPPESSGY